MNEDNDNGVAIKEVSSKQNPKMLRQKCYQSWWGHCGKLGHERHHE